MCSAFQDAVEKVFGERLPVKGASRTDAGVHANGFAIGLNCPTAIPCDALVRALNVNLPDDISVLDCREMPAAFHPRYDCVAKRYLYKIWNCEEKNPFLGDLTLQYKHSLDLARMNKAAGYLVGKHDFSAFCASGSAVEDKIRTIFDCHVDRQEKLVVLSITGDGFLYNMVRIITGTLLQVSAGKITPDEMADILASGERSRAGITAPPHGLYLDRVFYRQEELRESLEHPRR